MDSSELKKNRVGAIALAALALLAAMAVGARPAEAAPGQGTAEIRLAQHDGGRTLSGQRVELVADGGGAAREDRWLKLPIDAVETGEAASAGSPARLEFRRGGKGVALSDLRFDLVAGTIDGKLGGKEMAVFRQGAPSSVDAAAGSVEVQEGKLRLIRDAARLLRTKLGLDRPLAGGGVGMVWIAARSEASASEPADVVRPVASGVVEWGVLDSWRSYVLGHQGPPPPIVPPSNGTIAVSDGATANGDLAGAGGFLGFPAVDGSFESEPGGADARLELHTQGTVTFEKPAHCIIEVKLSDLELAIDGADSAIVLDSIYDIDTPEGMGCGPQPPVASDGVRFAALDLSGIAPVYSDGGNTVTWSEVPATLTADGAAAFGTGYPEGQELDPVTISVGLG